MNIIQRALSAVLPEPTVKLPLGEFIGGPTAGSLIGGMLPGPRGAPPARNAAGFLNAYGNMPWLHACAMKVGHSIACTEWQLYLTRKQGEKHAYRPRMIQRSNSYQARKAMLADKREAGDLVQVDDHPMLDLLHNPNSMLIGQAVRRIMQIHLDLIGETFLMKERDPLQKFPIGLWPMPPNWIAATPTPQHPYFEIRVKSFQKDVPESEILWIANPNPAEPYGRGVGTANCLSDELDTDEYTAKFIKQFFFNSARPDIIISPKGTHVNPSEMKRMEESWMQKLQGFWRSSKTYFASGEIDVKELQQSFRNLQLTQLRDFERNIIIQVFGIPPEIFGIIENSNRATIDAADYLFARHVLSPRLEYLRGYLQEKLAPEFDERLIVDYVSPVQEDKDFILRAIQAAPHTVSVDEIRSLQGLAPLENDDGKVFAMDSGKQLFRSFEEKLAQAEEDRANAQAALEAPTQDPKTQVPPSKDYDLSKLTTKQLEDLLVLLEQAKQEEMVAA